MKIVLILFFTAVCFGTIAQTTFNYKTDFKTILAKTKNTGEHIFYDSLLKRFKANDTTLTDYEVLALMIGFTAKPAYRPYADLETEKSIYKLNGEGKHKQALNKADSFLNNHPLNVNTLFEKSYSLYKQGMQDSADYYLVMGRRIFKAMFFSGKGITKATATFALGPTDGQTYIQKFIGGDIGTMGDGRDDNGNFLDMLEVKMDDGKSAMLYFNIQHAAEKMFKE